MNEQIETLLPIIDRDRITKAIIQQSVRIYEYSSDDFNEIRGLNIASLNRMGIIEDNNHQFKQGVNPMDIPNYEVLKKFVDTLGDQDRNEFYNDLLKASHASLESSNFKPLRDFLEPWYESAVIYTNTDITSRIQKAEDEFMRGEGVQWDPKNYE